MQLNEIRITPPPTGHPSAPSRRDRQAGEPSSAPITPGEREYFESLFPSSAAEIRTHTVYAPDGCRTRANLGGIVDRKG